MCCPYSASRQTSFGVSHDHPLPALPCLTHKSLCAVLLLLLLLVMFAVGGIMGFARECLLLPQLQQPQQHTFEMHPA
jgi:hypothetical protein